MLTNGARRLHVPVWLRVLDTTPVADVLLVTTTARRRPGFPDYSQVYKGMFNGAGRLVPVPRRVDAGLPVAPRPYHYKAVVIFTGNNDSFDTSGFSTADQDRSPSGSTAAASCGRPGRTSPRRATATRRSRRRASARARLYHGYLGAEVRRRQRVRAAAPRPTAEGRALEEAEVDLSPGARRRRQPELDRGLDADAGQRHLRGGRHDDAAVRRERTTRRRKRRSRSVARPSRASSGQRQEYLYRSLSMGFGLEGVNSNTGFARGSRSRGGVALALRHDHVRHALGRAEEAGQGPDDVTLTGERRLERRRASSRSSRGTSATARDRTTRQEADREPQVQDGPATTSSASQATDDLGHTAITTQTVHITG